MGRCLKSYVKNKVSSISSNFLLFSHSHQQTLMPQVLLFRKKKKRPFSPYSMCSNYWDIFLLLFNSKTSRKSSPSLIPPSESLLSSLQTDFSTQRVPLFRITVPHITKPNGHFSVLAWLHSSGRLSQMIAASSSKQLLHLVPTIIYGCTLILISNKSILPNIACVHTYSMKNTSVE